MTEDNLIFCRGAVVTGGDFLPEAIVFAPQLAAGTGLAGGFLGSDVYALNNVLRAEHTFDIVYISYGVLPLAA